MARKRDRTASRDAGFTRLLVALALCVAGLAGGMILGRLTVGDGLHGGGAPDASYAALSANPGAPATDSPPSLDCLDCADGYGVAARLRTVRSEPRGDAFRALGAVEQGDAAPQEPADGYRYGGRFPDAAPDRARTIAAPADAEAAGAATDGVARPDASPQPAPED